VKSTNERDESIDNLLRRTLRTPGGAGDVSGPCLDAQVLAAWAEGRLSSAEAANVEAHVADCGSCQHLLAVFAQTEPPAHSATLPAWRRWRLGWVVPAAAAATVAAIWISIPEDQRTAELQHRDALSIPDAARERPTSPAAAADASAPALEKKAVRPDAPPASSPAPALSDRAEQRSLDEVAPLAAAREAESKERDADLKAKTAAPPPRSPEQTPNRAAAAQAPAGFLRQAPSEVISPDPLIRWRILPEGRLERSADAGKTWQAVSFPQPISVTAVLAPASTTAIVTTADGRRFRTDDRGKTWNLVQP
jgi:hypothetical protein